MNEIFKAVIVDAATGETVERPLTADEILELSQIQTDQEAREAERIAKEEAKANGMAKLIALGLTEEEAGALIG